MVNLSYLDFDFNRHVQRFRLNTSLKSLIQKFGKHFFKSNVLFEDLFVPDFKVQIDVFICSLAFLFNSVMKTSLNNLFCWSELKSCWFPLYTTSNTVFGSWRFSKFPRITFARIRLELQTCTFHSLVIFTVVLEQYTHTPNRAIDISLVLFIPDIVETEFE